MHEQALAGRLAAVRGAVPVASAGNGRLTASQGKFEDISGEFRFDVNNSTRPSRPWINVLANKAFGAQISESGGGYSWAAGRPGQLKPAFQGSNRGDIHPVGDRRAFLRCRAHIERESRRADFCQSDGSA